MEWSIETLNATVDNEFRELPADMRALYVTAGPKRIVVVRVYLKKTVKTPRREIDLALRRANEVTG